VLIAYTIVSGLLLYNVRTIIIIFPRVIIYYFLYLIVYYDITSYIFFVECKFKARISAYSLYTIVSGLLLYNVGVMSDSTLIIIFPYTILFFVSYTII